MSSDGIIKDGGNSTKEDSVYDPLADPSPTNIISSIPKVPITVKRRPFRPPPDDARLPELGVARAHVAASWEEPSGSNDGAYANFASEHKHQTVLQQHLAFFDPDQDMVVWPWNTFQGFMSLGFGLILSLVAVFIIHPAFSWPTNAGNGICSYLQDPFFRIRLDKIHKTKHGSDSGSYDTEGRFVPQKFEDVFSKYADGKDHMTWNDIKGMMKGQRLLVDPFGWSAAFLEWGATYYMLWPADGKMRKEDARAVFDGTLFYKVKEDRQKRGLRNLKIF